jgi:hypothetical protein
MMGQSLGAHVGQPEDGEGGDGQRQDSPGGWCRPVAAITAVAAIVP